MKYTKNKLCSKLVFLYTKRCNVKQISYVCVFSFCARQFSVLHTFHFIQLEATYSITSRRFPSLLVITYVISRNYVQVAMGLYFSFVIMTTCVLLEYHLFRKNILAPSSGYKTHACSPSHNSVQSYYTASCRNSQVYSRGLQLRGNLNTSYMRVFHPVCYFLCFTTIFHHPFLPHH